MGKKNRERKMIKLETKEQEKQAIVERRKEKVAPFMTMTKRVVSTTVATIVLLYIGLFVNSHLAEILQRLKERG